MICGSYDPKGEYSTIRVYEQVIALVDGMIPTQRGFHA